MPYSRVGAGMQSACVTALESRHEPCGFFDLRMRDGQILAPELPGMGSELLPEFIRKYKVE